MCGAFYFTKILAEKQGDFELYLFITELKSIKMYSLLILVLNMGINF